MTLPSSLNGSGTRLPHVLDPVPCLSISLSNVHYLRAKSKRTSTLLYYARTSLSRSKGTPPRMSLRTSSQLGLLAPPLPHCSMNLSFSYPFTPLVLVSPLPCSIPTSSLGSDLVFNLLRLYYDHRYFCPHSFMFIS